MGEGDKDLKAEYIVDLYEFFVVKRKWNIS